MSAPWRSCVTALILSLAAGLSDTAHAARLQPFPVSNQGPMALLFNLPAPGDWQIVGSGTTVASLALDLANTYTIANNSHEDLLLDGESWLTTLSVRRGLGTWGGEVGFDLPVMGIGGGTFDGFITGWHDFFGLPQGGRNVAQKGQLHYRYQRDGVTRLDVTRSSGGIGDLRVFGGWQLTQDAESAVAVRGSVTLPTGNSAELRGSGAPGGALWLTGGIERPIAVGRLATWGSLGGVVLGKGDILPEQQRNFIAVGSVGIGWAPVQVIDFKLQLNGNSSLYSNSDLAPLNGFAALLVMGGSVHIASGTSVTIAVSEDLSVGTAADVALHISAQTLF